MLSRQKKRSFLDEVQRTMDSHGMAAPGDKILVGVSGGPDSVALLLCLVELGAKLNLTLGVAHINHLLRGEESDRDERFVKGLARNLGLSFESLKIDVAGLASNKKTSLEETARKVRYDFFTTLCQDKGYSLTAVGHTRDDNTEQVLMNLLRGSGPRGLAGIPPVRDGWIIRPLIDHSKQEILAFLKSRGQPHVVDSTNLENVFLRNRIRNELLPLLRKDYNPAITDNLNRMSKIMGEEERWMEGEARSVFTTICRKETEDEVCLCLTSFNDLALALKRRIVRRAIEGVKKDLKRITLVQTEAVIALAAARSPGRNLDLPGRVRITKRSQSLCFKKEILPLREIGRAVKRKKRFQNS